MECKIETKLIYRFYLLGLLTTLIFTFSESLSDFLHPYPEYIMQRNWLAILITKGILLAVVILLIISNNSIKIHSNVFDIGLLDVIILILIFYLSLQFSRYPNVWVFILIISWLLFKGKSLSFITKVKKSNQDNVIFQVGFRNIFIILAQALILTSLSYEIMSLALENFFPVTYSSDPPMPPSYTYLNSLGVSYVILMLLLYIIKRNYPKNEINKSNEFIKFIIYLTSFVVLVLYAPGFLYIIYIGDIRWFSFLLLLVTFIVVCLSIHKVNFKQIENETTMVIRATIIISSIIYFIILMTTYYHLPKQEISSYLYINTTLVLLLLVFNKKISQFIVKRK